MGLFMSTRSVYVDWVCVLRLFLCFGDGPCDNLSGWVRDGGVSDGRRLAGLLMPTGCVLCLRGLFLSNGSVHVEWVCLCLMGLSIATVSMFC